MSSAGDHEKSAKNRVTEKAGLAVLLADAKGRFQAPDTATKKELLKHLGLKDETANYGAQSFDAVYSDKPVPALTPENVGRYADRLHIVEMKTTKKPIPDSSLAGFFFGATEREYKLAENSATGSASPSWCSTTTTPSGVRSPCCSRTRNSKRARKPSGCSSR